MNLGGMMKLDFMKQKINDNKKIYFFLSFSLFIHFLISIIHISNTSRLDKISDLDNKKQKIRIKLFKSSLKKQIVVSEESKNKDISKLKKITKLSKSNNVFDRETQAANGMKFKHAGLGKKDAIDKKQLNMQTKALPEKFKDIKFSDLGIKSKKLKVDKFKKKISNKSLVKKGLKTGSSKQVGLGATSDHLKDIPLGDFTKLNTQEYEYFGFYNRIRIKLEQFWGYNIKDKAEKIFKQGRAIASDANLVTGLTIKINGNGEIVDISVKSASGVKELDDAAIESFNQAGPFPNPPKGMLKADGKAVIEWGFVVNT